MAFNLSNLFSNIMGTNNNGQNNNQSPIINDYPEVFYTNSKYIQNNNMQNTNQQNSIFNQSNFSNFLNVDTIKNIIPLLLNKSGGFNLSNLLSNNNTSISNIMSLFTNNKTNNKEKGNNKKINNDNIIDLTEYKEVE